MKTGDKANGKPVDVVVIGAGAAGIAAARDLRKTSLTVQVVEAAGRIGGRVHTDLRTFGAPYDVGAHWMHYREANPFADYGIAHGFDIYPAPSAGILRIGTREATPDEYRACAKAERKALKAMTRAAKAKRCVAPSEVMPDLGEWASTVHFLTGPYEIGKDLDSFSCRDWYSAEEGTDYYCREGFGALFAHSARDVPVSLNTTARLIRWGGAGVAVETDKGTIDARAVVVTVSMGVLQQGGLLFDPALPQRKQEAIQVLEMGHYNHVALRFSQDVFGLEADGYFRYKIDKFVNGVPQGFAGLVDAGGTGIAYFDLGGSFARDMGKAGREATIAFVLDELKNMFGSAIERALTGQATYDWSSDPLACGAYSATAPGGAWSRKELRRPVADRIWFAGEALSRDDWATVAGAHKSGRRVTRKLANTLPG